MTLPIFFMHSQSFFSSFNLVKFSVLSLFILVLILPNDFAFAQSHDHGSTGSGSSGSEAGGAGSFIGLDGYQAQIALSNLGNCLGCNNNTKSQSLTIFKHSTNDFPFLVGGSMFMVTPNPYAFTNFSGSINPQFFGPNLVIKDNDPLDSDPTLGVIELVKVNPGVYSVWEVIGPPGLTKNNAPHSSSEVTQTSYPLIHVTNIFLNATAGMQTMPAPPLPTEKLTMMQSHGAQVNGKTIDQLPSSMITTKTSALSGTAPTPILLTNTLSSGALGWTTNQRFSNLGIPTYDGPPITGDSSNAFIPPVFVAKNTDGSRFVLSPKISQINPGTNLVLRLDNIIQYDNHHGTHGPAVQGIKLPFAVSSNDVGVSVQVKQSPPSSFPDLDPTDGSQVLFIDVTTDGDIDLSSTSTFSENPTINFYLDKNSDGSCPTDATVYLLINSGKPNAHWHAVEVGGHAHSPTPDTSSNTSTQCAYTQEVEHFSSYLVGTGSSSSGGHNHGSSGSGHDHGSHGSDANHAGHDMMNSYTLTECTVNGLIRDIYANKVYLQIHTNSDGDINTNTGPGDFYIPGEVRGQLYYQYGSKFFTTTAKSSNEVLTSVTEKTLWAKSRATATASFESTNFNELKYVISGKDLSNVSRISLYYGDQYTNSDTSLLDIMPADFGLVKLDSAPIRGTITNNDLCKTSTMDGHDMTSHEGHAMDEPPTNGDVISHEGHTMEEQPTQDGILSHDEHVTKNPQASMSTIPQTCYGVTCVDPEPKDMYASLTIVDSSDSMYDFGEFSGKRLLAGIYGKSFPLTYNVNGQMTKISVNPDKNSLTLYFDNVFEDTLTLRIPRALIDAENNNFLVMITASPERLAEYQITTSDDSFFILQMNVPDNTSKVSIIGTRVVPEFGPIAIIVLAVSIISIIAVSKRVIISTRI